MPAIRPPSFGACLLVALYVASGRPLVAADAPPPTREQAEFFEKGIRPVLVTHCVACHGAKKQESGLRRVIDPWGGSFYVERLTHDLAKAAWGHIEEVEKLGGMTRAIEASLPKLRIEEAAARTQARPRLSHRGIVIVRAQ